MADEFVGVFENFLGTKRVEISLAEIWNQCPPSEASGKPLKEYLSKVCFQSSMYVKFDEKLTLKRVHFGPCAMIIITDLTTSERNMNPNSGSAHSQDP